MNTTCSTCGSPNSALARFCRDCGRMLGVTSLNGKTMIQVHEANRLVANLPNPGSPAALFPGPHPRIAGTVFGGGAPGQRELTFFVNDISNSMDDRYDDRYTKLEAVKRATVTMVVNKATLDPGDEIGLIAFNSHAQVLLGLSPISSHKRQIIEIVQSLVANNGTDINEGLTAAEFAFDWNRGGVVHRIVLMTDGQGGHPLQTADRLKQHGVIIDVIGVGDDPSNVDEKLLKKVASVVQGELRYRFIKDQQTLINHYTHLAQKTRIGA